MKPLSIELPDELLALIGEHRAQALAREALLVRLYDLGEISSGKAAQLLGISRRAFLDVLGGYHVAIFDESADFEQDMRNAEAASRT